MGYKSIFICVLLLSSSIFCQTLEVTYDIEIKQDGITDNNKKNEIGFNYLKSMYDQARKDINNYPMEFLISNNEYSIDFSQSLEIDNEMQKIITPKKVTLGFIGLNETIYNNENTSYTLYNNIVTSYNLKNLTSWEITNESKKILGYNCLKAYFKTNIPELKRVTMITPRYAWFTTEIPLKGGPTIFGNLPGLILELNTKLASFKAISIQQTNKQIKNIDFKDKKIMSFIETEKYYKNTMEKEIKN